MLILAAFMPSGLHAQLPSEVFALFEKNRWLGISVSTICGGEVDRSFHFGYLDPSKKRPVNDSTMFRAASISKLVTATGLMKLYEQGAFSLDEDVSYALGIMLRHPKYPQIPITYKMLLSHTSGLKDGSGFENFLIDTKDDPSHAPALGALFIKGTRYDSEDNWSPAAPGAYFNYANVNYGIIGTLIEKLSGKRFDLYMKEEVLQPLGIRGSFNESHIVDTHNISPLFRRSDSDWELVLSAGSASVSDAYIPGHNAFVFAPQGGLRASALELARMLVFHETGEGGLLRPETLALMHQPHWTYTGANGNTENGLFLEYGLGTHIAGHRQKTDKVFTKHLMYGHPAEAYGLIGHLYWGGPNGSGFVVLINGMPKNAGSGDGFYAGEKELFAILETFLTLECKDQQANARISPFMSITPNPAREFVFLRSNFEMQQVLYIRDITGRTMWEQSIQPNEIIHVDVSLWPTGSYQVETNYNRSVLHGWFDKQD